MRFATVAIVGRANVGKSTFLNSALGEPLAIVSPWAQTTRDNLLGVVHRPDAQLAFLDTPGIHRPRSELGRRMNAAAFEAARLADVLLFMTDVFVSKHGPKRELAPGVEDLELLERLPPRAPAVAVINKVDLVRDKARLLPLLAALEKARAFQAVLPVSLRHSADVARVIDALVGVAPEGPPAHEEDTLTDRPSSFFVREYVRESVLHATFAEVPHAVAVSVDEFVEGKALVRICATLHVEKPGQRKILVGTRGSTVREIGIRARERIESLLGRKVHLELFVRVTPHWRDAPRLLAELGHEAAGVQASQLARAGQSNRRKS